MFDKNNCIVLGTGYLAESFVDAGYNNIGIRHIYDPLDIYWNWDDIIDIHKIKYVINATGYTDTTKSEDPNNFHEVMRTNCDLVRNLSRYCYGYGIKLLHLSTGDLYGNTFNFESNVETKTELSIGTTYRFSKLCGERYCHKNDLILRIRLPYSSKIHPKNLIYKVRNYKNFYQFQNCFTYVPDLIRATEALLEADASGIFNVVQDDSASILYLQRNILGLEHLQHIDMHDKEHPNLITKLDNVHIHNIIDVEKIKKYITLTDLAASWIFATTELNRKPLANT